MKTPKKPFAAVIICISSFLMLTLALGGCSADPVGVTVVLKNSTDYELESISFNISTSRGSPMHDLFTSEDESIKPGEQREITFAIMEKDLRNVALPYIKVLDDEERYNSNTIYLDPDKNATNHFEITCDDDMNFIFTVISE